MKLFSSSKIREYYSPLPIITKGFLAPIIKATASWINFKSG